MILIMILCSHLNVCHKEEIPTEAVLPMQCAQAAMEFASQDPRYTLTWFRCQRREHSA